MGRRRAREVAMCLLYEREMNIDAQENTLREMCDVLKSDRLEEKNCAYIGDVLAVYDERGDRLLSFHNIAYPGKSSGFPASISLSCGLR